MIASNRTLLIATLICLAALSRLIPHPPNFVAVGAVGLFAGASLANRWLSLCIPLAAMAISDAILGYSWMTAVVYAAMSLYVVVGWWAGQQIETRRLIVAALTGSIGFFIITNFACWLSMYERSWTGFSACYTAAIPFFQNTLTSDLVYGISLFAALKVAEWQVPTIRLDTEASFG